MTAMTATTATMNHATAATTPMMTLKRIQAASARTMAATTRATNEGPDFSVFSIPQMYSRGRARSRGQSVVAALEVLVAPATGGPAVELQAREAIAAHLRRVGIARRDGVAPFDEQDAGSG